jgi:hypothetical protein
MIKINYIVNSQITSMLTSQEGQFWYTSITLNYGNNI